MKLKNPRILPQPPFLAHLSIHLNYNHKEHLMTAPSGQTSSHTKSCLKCRGPSFVIKILLKHQS